jgi:hypothetical protein
MKKSLLIITALIVSFSASVFSQGTTIRSEKKDEVKPLNYPYVMPILGDKVAKKGFQLPLPQGIMINTFYGTQDLSISGLEVGFNNGELINLDSIVKFSGVSSKAFTINMRVDTWILPFWDFYVLGGYGNANTTTSISQPFQINTDTKSEGYYVGLGSTLAFGIRGFFASLDGSYIWNYQDVLTKPAQVLTMGLRTGPVFKFKKHKEMNIIPWVGVLFTNLNSETLGSISFKEVFPDSDGSKITELQTKLDDWYNGLGTPAQKVFEDAYNKLSDGLENVSENAGNSTIQYEMKKSIDHPFNLIIGGQYQVNLRWQVRGEAQIFGDRFGGLLSLNYRFGIKGKNFLGSSM